MARQEASGSGLSPFVVQCCKCNTLVTDNVAFQTAFNEGDPDMELLCFSACYPSVKLCDDNLVMSRTGFDMGCSFYNVVCTNCNIEIGRYYFTTATELDFLRKRYCLYRMQVTVTLIGVYSEENSYVDLTGRCNSECGCEQLKLDVVGLRQSFTEVFNAIMISQTGCGEDSMATAGCASAMDCQEAVSSCAAAIAEAQDCGLNGASSSQQTPPFNSLAAAAASKPQQLVVKPAGTAMILPVTSSQPSQT